VQQPASGSQFGFNFNIVNLEPDGNARIVPYTAVGGTFRDLEPFLAQEPEASARRILAAAGAECGYKGHTMAVLLDINSDGDCHFVSEIRGFKIGKGGKDLSEFPFPVTASVNVNVDRVERFNAQPLGPKLATALRLRRHTPVSPRKQTGTIEFGRPRFYHEAPLNYYWSYYRINSYAMSLQQYSEMYGEDRAPTESAMITLRSCPFDELVMIVQFPPDFTMDGEPELLVTDLEGRSAVGVTHRLHCPHH
jgi:hypothetical protein